MKRRSRGFTLMELMVTLAVAGVILAIGAPSFRDYQRNNRLIVSANDMLGLVIGARSEALRRQLVVSTCPSADPANPAATCGTGAGWIAFIDLNSNCERDTGEELVANAVIASDVNASSNGTCMSFAASGFRRVVASQPNTQRMIFCDNRGNTARFPGQDLSTARGVEVLPTGRPAVIKSVSELAVWTVGAESVTCS